MNLNHLTPLQRWLHSLGRDLRRDYVEALRKRSRNEPVTSERLAAAEEKSRIAHIIHRRLVEELAPFRRKRYAIYSGIRHQACDHVHRPFTGRIPMTGVRRCSMCGLEFDPDEDLPFPGQEADCPDPYEKEHGNGN